MAIESTQLQVTLLIEDDAEASKPIWWLMSTEEEIRKAVLAAVAVLLRDRPYVRVEWSSCRSIPLDGKPWFGRYAVCKRWVYDCESPSEMFADGVARAQKLTGGPNATSICRTGIHCV